MHVDAAPQGMQTIVIGHRNPDMDSICSAVGYAELKRLMGMENVVAARAGDTNERIDYVLAKFGVEPPQFMSDVSPRVSDVMEMDVVSVRADCSAYEAIHLIEEKRLRGLPVVDSENRCLGLLSAYRISHHLFPPREEAATARIVTASLENLVETFNGTLLAGSLGSRVHNYVLVVGAMHSDSFASRLRNHNCNDVILFVGDRSKIQATAIAAKVRAVVVTGGCEISEEVRAAAAEAGVTMISSAYDTATTVLLARGGVKVEGMLSSEYVTFSADMPLEEAREKAGASRHLIFPVLDEQGRIAGVLSKSDFIKPNRRQLILVDHNELSQAVRGADKLPIIEIIDHHRIGGFASSAPILFWNNPVGSTSTIVALCYRQAGIKIPPKIAGLLLAGLIADTLNLTSPTATETDREIREMLSQICGTDAAELAEQIFSVGSPLLTMSPDQIIRADAKEYVHDECRFSVSQIEELNFIHFDEAQSELMDALERHCRSEGLSFAALLVTDISAQNSLLLVSGSEALRRQIDFPACGPQTWELAGVVSRKKQLLPYLLRCIEQMKG
jgi:manganese-dependent inorganic pyrophosphatase